MSSKAYKDTPQSEKMFGSLVVVLPIIHSGGALHLRHEGEEVIHDSSSKFQEHPYNSVSWVAFFSHVEHEVAKIESGHRVTLRYNLYYANQVDSDTPDPNSPNITSNTLFKSFAGLLTQPDFLPDGGLVGFGLKYKYPIDLERTNISSLGKVLKGRDGLLFRIAKLLKLEPELKVVYRTDRDGTFLCNTSPPNMYLVDDLSDTLRSSCDGEMIEPDEDDEHQIDLEVHWVNSGSSRTAVKSHIRVYAGGFSIATDELYGQVVLIVKIGEKGSRM